MNTVEQFASSIAQNEQSKQDKFEEQFDITKARTNGGKFNITLTNTGNIPISIERLWVENKSATDWIQKYKIDKNANPGETITNIGQNIGLTAVDTNSYDMRFITSRGNTNEFLINSASSQPLDIQLRAIPATILDQFKTTLVMTVTNNMSSNNLLMNLQPSLSQTSGAAAATLDSGPSPSSHDFLKSGDTATFKWVYTMSGNDGETKTFEASLQNGYSGNISTDTVSVEAVEFSLQSGTALESEGLAITLANDDILILHEETEDALDGKQLHSADPENPTTLDTTSTQTELWYTNNGTSTIDIPSGEWNLNLRYFSKEVPDGIDSPDLIYHFESETTGTTPDSSGNNRDLDVNGALIGSVGRHNTQGYTFDGTSDGTSNYLEGQTPLTSSDDIGDGPDTTVGWFNTTDQTGGEKTIYRVGDGSEYYEIFLQDGILYMRFTSDPDRNPPQGLCDSGGFNNLYNGNWQHFVAVRDGDFTCRIYINGTLASSGVDTSSCSNCNPQDSKAVEPSGAVNIGRDPASGGDYFNGDLDQVFHWNDYEFASNEPALLYNANYGSSAHLLDFVLEKVDKDGNNPVLIKEDLNYPIQFHDGEGSSTNWSPGLKTNYTTGTISAQTFSAGERLKLSFSFKNGLNMTLQYDDPSLTDPYPTFLQIPEPSEPFPSYVTYDNDENPSLDVFNQGPHGSWVTYLTRIVFDDHSSDAGYAAHINSACGESMNNSEHIRKDSPLIKVNSTCTIQFERARNPPDAQAEGNTNLIPPGQYKVHVFLSGYDERGELFLRTIDLGLVKVVE